MPPMLGDHPGHVAMWASINAHFQARTLECRLPSLAMPALLIHGALDPIPAAETERTAALIPGARLRVLDRIGHFPWLEQPGTIRRLVSELAAG